MLDAAKSEIESLKQEIKNMQTQIMIQSEDLK